MPALEGLSDHINEQLAELARDLRVSIMTRDPRWCSFRNLAQPPEPSGAERPELRELEIALEVTAERRRLDALIDSAWVGGWVACS